MLSLARVVGGGLSIISGQSLVLGVETHVLMLLPPMQVRHGMDWVWVVQDPHVLVTGQHLAMGKKKQALAPVVVDTEAGVPAGADRGRWISEEGVAGPHT